MATPYPHDQEKQNIYKMMPCIHNVYTGPIG